MIINCARCGKLFVKTARDVCPQCIREEQVQFQTVRTYLSQNRKAILPEIVKETGVELELIMQFIDEKRLILKDYPNLSLACERCGIATQEGRFCKKCKDSIIQELAEATESVRMLRQQSEGQELEKGPGYYSKS